MRGTRITITGADEAHYLSVSKEASRLIRFPDGVSRHITLSNWHWEVFDKLIKEKGWSKRAIPKAAYEHAIGDQTYPNDFEKQIRFSLKGILKCAMPDVMKEEDWTISNERI